MPKDKKSSFTRRISRLLFALALAAAPTGPLVVQVLTQPTTRTVCALNCTFTNSQFQAGIDATAAGDTLLTQAGFTYVGAFTLKSISFTGVNWATIQTGVTSIGGTIAASAFPAANIRMTPALAGPTTGNLSKFQTNANNVPVFTTSVPPAVVKGWRLRFVEVIPNAYAGNVMLQFGNDSNAVQTQKSEIPGPFEIDRCYIHGDPKFGQYRAVGVWANSVDIHDSDLREIKSQAEGQVIYANSHVTGFRLVNNYIEGGTENVIFGGGRGAASMFPTVQASPAPTTTSARLSAATDLVVGQGVSFLVGGVEQYTEITGVSGVDVTFTTIPLTAAPDVPGGANYGLNPGNATIQKNYFTKPLSWQQPIVGTPQSVQATGSTSGGTLGGGALPATYYYKVVARHATSNGQTARSTASAEVSGTVDSGTTGSVTISWAAVTNAETYYIYGRSAGGENVRFSVTAPTVTFTDTGGAGTTETVPTSTGTTWQVKNSLEFKNVDTALIEGNVFENVWAAGQAGYLVLFTPANTGNGNASTHVRHITFRKNLLRHAAAGFQITGRQATGTGLTGRTIDVNINNNLMYDVGNQWGASVRTMYIGTNYFAALANQGNTLAPADLVMEHNTFDHGTGNAFLYLDLFKNSTAYTVNNFTYRNNIDVKKDYGLTGNNACTQGSGCWNAYTAGTKVWDKNVIADAAVSVYPGGATNNYGPTYAALQATFTNYASQSPAGYVLLATSPYHLQATDATDIGADIASITALTNVAISGDNSGTPPPTPPAITTNSLPSVTLGNTYSHTLAATSCGVSCTWAVTAGALPTGITLSSAGVLSGAPTVVGVATFTVRATATNGATDSRQFTISVLDVPPDTSICNTIRLLRYNFVENASFVRDVEPSTAAPDCARVGDIWVDTTAGRTKLLKQTSPVTVWEAIGASSSGINIMFMTSAGSYNNWSMSTTAQELFNAARNRVAVDLTNMTQCRTFARVSTTGAGASGWVQYSADTGATWFDLGTTASTPSVDLSVSNNLNVGAFVNIATNAKADVILRIWGVAGSSVTPSLGNWGLNCK